MPPLHATGGPAPRPGRNRQRLALFGDVLGARLLGRFRPLSLGWEVTTACNATCVYCAFRRAAPDELSTAEALRLVDEMKVQGTRMVSLSGGEPLLRPDLARIVDALLERGMTLSLNTNGFLVPRHRALIGRMSRVKISLDGLEPVHDAVRGKGSFRLATRAIELCRDWGVPITVEAVLSRTSLPRVDELVAWCRARDLSLQVQPADPFILDSDRPNPEAPDGASLAAVLLRLQRSPDRHTLLNSSAGLAHLRHYPSPTPMRCASGRVTARIGSNGLLRLCGVPPAHAPTASWREHGLAGAFARLSPVACDRCWCAPRVDLNLGYQGRNTGAFLRDRAAGVLPGARGR